MPFLGLFFQVCLAGLICKPLQHCTTKDVTLPLSASVCFIFLLFGIGHMMMVFYFPTSWQETPRMKQKIVASNAVLVQITGLCKTELKIFWLVKQLVYVYCNCLHPEIWILKFLCMMHRDNICNNPYPFDSYQRKVCMVARCQTPLSISSVPKIISKQSE